ncbi:MAG: hypothetical protein AB7O97_10780 [Planctomycetota bacterium]
MPLTQIPEVRAAATRLRGHLVASPLIGGVRPGGDGDVDVRWKADILQPGASGWFRGYLHLLQRSFGALPGVSFAGPEHRLLAAALATRQHRLELLAFAALPPAPALADALRRLDVDVQVAGDPAAEAAAAQRRRGFLPLPGGEHPEVATGMATLGLELAADLPSDCRAVYAPPDWCDPVRAGLAAGGRTLPVIEVLPAEDPVAGDIAAAAASLHGVLLSPRGAAVLARALAHPERCVVAAVVAE